MGTGNSELKPSQAAPITLDQARQWVAEAIDTRDPDAVIRRMVEHAHGGQVNTDIVGYLNQPDNVVAITVVAAQAGSHGRNVLRHVLGQLGDFALSARAREEAVAQEREEAAAPKRKGAEITAAKKRSKRDVRQKDIAVWLADKQHLPRYARCGGRGALIRAVAQAFKVSEGTARDDIKAIESAATR